MTILFRLQGQGHAITGKFHTPNNGKTDTYFLSFPMPHHIKSYPLILREDACFKGVCSIFPQFIRGWTVLLDSQSTTTISLFYEGYLYYKRTLQRGADVMEEVTETLRYMGKYGANVDQCRIIYLSKTDLSLTHPQIKVQRIDALWGEIEAIGMKKAIRFHPPLHSENTLLGVQHYLKQSIGFVMIPLLLLTSVGFACMHFMYSEGDFRDTRDKVTVMKNTILPKDQINTLHTLNFHPISLLSKIHPLLNDKQRPQSIQITYHSRNVTLGFDHIFKFQGKIPGYKIAQKGKTLVIEEVAK